MQTKIHPVIRVAVLTFGVVGLSFQAHAASVYGLPADLTGIRTTDTTVEISAVGGLTGFGNEWFTDFGVQWDIVDNGNGTWDYTYTFLGFGNPDKNISNFVLDITDDCITNNDPNCITNPQFNGSPIGSGDIEFGDFSGITGGVKFDLGSGNPSEYTFTSNRAPVWGHLAMKDGGGPETCAAPGGSNIVCSNRLLGIGDEDQPIHYVARPNGVGVIPIPAAVWLFGSALGMLGWMRRRKT
ncbi:MAG: VPLPA-CTERM sorting domain-containing protein [Gammaproteobacteria bacterium]